MCCCVGAAASSQRLPFDADFVQLSFIAVKKGGPGLPRRLTRPAGAAQVARSEWVQFVRDCETFYINFTPEGADQARRPRLHHLSCGSPYPSRSNPKLNATLSTLTKRAARPQRSQGR